MAVPKRKTSKSRAGKRRSHLRFSSLNLSPCPQCHHLRLPHRACPFCGTYQGREILSVKKEK